MTLRALVRILAGLTLTVLTLLGPTPAALAQDACYPPPCAPGISDSTTVAGQPVTVTSGNESFEPDEAVEYGVQSVYQRIGRATANAAGAVVVTFRMPTLASGNHHVVFTSLVDGDQVRVPFTVLTAAATRARTTVSLGDGKLSRTGSTELLLLAAGGAGLFVAGAAVVLSVRRRRLV